MNDIVYELEPELSPAEFIDLLRRSTLADRRPVEHEPTIDGMLNGASVIVAARCNGLLVGVARGISDHAYCSYLSDLAVDQAHQGRGVGRALLRRSHEACGLHTRLILLAAPRAESYYEHLGLERHGACFTIAPQAADPAECGDKEGEAPDVTELPAGEQPLCNASAVTAQPVGEFFNSLTGDYNAAITRCFPRYNEMLQTLIGYAPSSDVALEGVVELGCGTGNLSLQVRQRYPGAELHLIDLSSESIAACASRLNGHENVRFTVADMRSLQLKEASCDLIVSSIAIHHLTSQEKRQLFADCYRWLRPGGQLLFADQMRGDNEQNHARHMGLWKEISSAAGASSQEWDSWMQHQREHDYHDTLADHFRWLTESGFADVDVLWRYLLWTIVRAEKV